MKAVFEFMGGRKMALCVLAIVAVTLLACLGKIPAHEAVEWITYLAAIGAGSMAIEDGAGKVAAGLGRRPPPKGVR